MNQSRLDTLRHRRDDLRKMPRKSELTLKGGDLDWFRLVVFGFRGHLPEPGEACWIWSGQTSDGGSPVMTVQGKRAGARRAAYATWIRPIKDGEVIFTACGHHLCVNPAHLAARDYAEDEWDWMVDHSKADARVRAMDPDEPSAFRRTGQRYASMY
jgi:hypothetical protein